MTAVLHILSHTCSSSYPSSSVFKSYCGQPLDSVIDSARFNPSTCGGITVLPQATFYPVGWFAYNTLYSDMRSDEGWAEQFKHSTAVHMYFSSKRASKKILRPKFYGADRPAYLYLALNNCPASFYSERDF